MAETKYKLVPVSGMPTATSIDNLYTLGTDNTNKSVKVPITLLKGNKGDAPFVGVNGNWWVGIIDTGVPSVIAVSQEKGQDTVKAPSLKLFTDENALSLKKVDLISSGETYTYSPNINGTINSAKASSMLINALAKAKYAGTLSKITINSGESGALKVHIFSKVDNIFTSVANKLINVSVGVGTYTVDLNVSSPEYYVGIEISATYASVRTFRQTANLEGFYGGADGAAMTFASGALICYGFLLYIGNVTPRPDEVILFEDNILNMASANTDKQLSTNISSSGHQLYAYNMQSLEPDFVQSGWNFSSNGAQPSISGLTGKLYINKQINIETKIQRAVAILNSNTNLLLYSEGKEDSKLKSAVSVNMSDNSINIYEIFASAALPSIRSTKTVSFTLVSGRKYIIEMYRLPRANGVRIIDTLTGQNDYLEVNPTQSVHGTDKEVYAGGLQYDAFGVCWLGGTAPLITELSCGYFGKKNPLLYIVGDSITYGYGTNDISKAYAHLIGNLTGGDYVVSPRGGGKISGVIEKILNECSIIKPQYIMVTIGTNQAASIAQLQQLIDGIETIGAIPIINCIPCRTNGEQTAANNNILSMGVYSCRFDIATAADPTATTLKADLSLYVDGGVHPNEAGYAKMADRVRIDLPFLF
ncbi:MAG: SGNH/GDSL hydrolase family protein [Prevotella sp.]|jgi:lysophospholipase L1-like esterase|nr:SGNH/GDSL hydrolase family protein [Prevotella sp.]